MDNKQELGYNMVDSEKGYSLSEFYYIIRKHIKIVIFTFFALLLSITVYTYSISPIYKSSATIMISKDKSSMSLFEMSANSDRNFIENEMEILKSRTTSELAIRRLLENNSINEMIFFGAKNKKTFLSSFFQPNILKIDNSQEQIEKYASKLKKSISVSSSRNNDAILISVESQDPVEAAFLVNTLVDVYKNRDLEWVTGEMTHLKSFLINQLDNKKVELNDAELSMKDFQEKEKIFSLDENSTLILENLTRYETDFNNTLASLKIMTEKENYLNHLLNEVEIDLIDKVTKVINDRLFALKEERLMLETELVSTTTKYGLSHSGVIEIKSKLSKVKTQIEEETRKLIENGFSAADPLTYRQSLVDTIISNKAVRASLTSKLEAYKKLVEEYDNKLTSLPDKLLEFTKLERKRAIHAETYSFMSKKLEEARIGEASKISKIRIIDKAVPNRKPIKPDKLLNLFLGLVLGGSIGIGLAFIIEFFDNTIKTIEQIERRGLPILSMIPSIERESKNKKTKKYISKNLKVDKIERRLITHEDPKSPISEAYRTLRTSLMYTDEKKGKCNIILVSSPGPGEGKTTTVANLAITYANLGKKTLLIDSDLRKPVVHKIFNKDKSRGLTSFLSGENIIDEIINKTDINNLDVITSRIVPPNPSELLDSDAMESIIENLKEQYDVILFDTPPLIAVTDAFVVLKHVDQFLLVVRAGVTERGALERILSSLSQANFNLTGVVMNDMSQSNSYGAGYYYNYYQYYYAEGK